MWLLVFNPYVPVECQVPVLGKILSWKPFIMQDVPVEWIQNPNVVEVAPVSVDTNIAGNVIVLQTLLDEHQT